MISFCFSFSISREQFINNNILILVNIKTCDKIQKQRIRQNMTIIPNLLSYSLLIIIPFLLIEVSSVYDVPSYYGHFSKFYFRPQKISEGRFRYFEYHYAVDIDNRNQTIYFANTEQNCIEKFNLTDQRKTVFAGICGQTGNRVGGLDVMMFKGPTSVVYFQFNEESNVSEANMKISIVANNTCSLSDPTCILTYPPSTLSIENLRPNPPTLQFPGPSPPNPQYLYISDTENHCIKRINIGLKTSEIVAGKCGQPGFLDGPQGFNRLNRPSNLGITRSGVLYFWDQGNQYMRKIDNGADRVVETLQNGACKKFGKSRQILGYTLNNVLCYDNWVEGETKASKQHIIDSSEINICIEHASKCI